MRGGRVNFRDFENFRNEVEQRLCSEELSLFFKSCAKELAARLLAKVIKRTPVRKPKDCPPGVKGGTLRRGWTAGTGRTEYINGISVEKNGDSYSIEIINPVNYASYVEFGHRKRNTGWVEGRFMLTIPEEEIKSVAPQILERKLEKKLKECFK